MIIPEDGEMIPLEVGKLTTVGGLVAVLQTFPPDWKLLLNGRATIITVDGRDGELWLCDLQHTPHTWLRQIMPREK